MSIPYAMIQQDLTANWRAANQMIADAAKTHGRRLDDICLLAVVKQQSPAKIAVLSGLGARYIGENRIDEAAAHWSDPALSGVVASGVVAERHLIGPLQRNKARRALELFDVIQTLDRPALVESLARLEAEMGLRRRYYIEVNLAAEVQKAGVLVADLAALYRQARDAGLKLDGLMCIPPAEQPPRPYFTQLANLAGELGLAGLSMGMSGDFTEAIGAGATIVRLGSILFGSRHHQPA